MNSSLERICAEYSAAELELIAGFLRQATDAGRNANEDLAEPR